MRQDLSRRAGRARSVKPAMGILHRPRWRWHAPGSLRPRRLARRHPRARRRSAVRGLRGDGGRPPAPVPPGRHDEPARQRDPRGRAFFKEVLEREGIPVEIDEFAPGRANLLATLKGSGARRALILANHMDVVPADASRWTVPPFSGAVKDGLVYGRGRAGHEDGRDPAARHPDPRAAGAPAPRPRHPLPGHGGRGGRLRGRLARAEPGRLAGPPARGRILHHRGRRERDRRRRPARCTSGSTPRRRGRSGCASPRPGRPATARGRWPIPR